MNWEFGLVLALIITASVSVVSSLFVTVNIIKFGHAKTSTKLVLYLHLNQIVQDISILPSIYHQFDLTCKIAGWLHAYSAMAIMLIVAMMGLHYRQMFFDDKTGFSHFCSHHCTKIIFIFPLLTLYPFITDSYGAVHDSFCLLSQASKWNLLIPLISCVIGIFSMGVLASTTIHLYLYNAELGRQLFSSIDMYALCTYVFWIPRIYFEVTNTYTPGTIISIYFLVFVAGISYCLLFLREKTSMKLFEKSHAFVESNFVSSNGSSASSTPSSPTTSLSQRNRNTTYSWEVEEENEEQNNALTRQITLDSILTKSEHQLKIALLSVNNSLNNSDGYDDGNFCFSPFPATPKTPFFGNTIGSGKEIGSQKTNTTITATNVTTSASTNDSTPTSNNSDNV